MSVLPSEYRALEWAFHQLGAIPLNEAPLSSLCRDVWEAWWDAQRPRSSGWFHERLLDELEVAARRPVEAPVLVSRLASGVRVRGWVRTADLWAQVDGYHQHSIDEMAVYGSSWDRDRAYEQMLGAWWRLEETADGWAARVTQNGNHRSLLALASGVPLVPVLASVVRAGQPGVL
jgi:hypothetical protein